MTDWTKPRAYIVTMTGAQTRELERAFARKLVLEHAKYLAKLQRENP